MVVDKKGKMLTAREYPSMVLIEVKAWDTVITLSYPGMDDVSVNVPDINTVTDTQSEVFGEKCQGVDMGEITGRWLSEVQLSV